MDYQISVELALSLGYERVIDSGAFNGEYFIKDGKKWIHWIEKLKEKLCIMDDEMLRVHGYDLDNYYKYRMYDNGMALEEIKKIRSEIESAIIGNTNSVLTGRFDILNNEDRLESLTLLKKEGFDDEILYDYDHQMSKR